jgi:GT2 family glycosyltransferase
MTQPSTRQRHPSHLVTAVLVAHDGAAWLTEVLEALASQTRKPERFVAADTDSHDGSAQIITDTIGPGTVVQQPRDTPFGDAVQAGLDAFAGIAYPDRGRSEPLTEWVWLLHDDCAPEPTALDELLTRVTQAPSVWLVGPKVRGWEGGRLLEAGLTIDPVGNVDTGIDGVELDQGQRDDVDEVLAVGTAGALIRRDVWDRLGGLDPAWPTYGDDIDLGWRINAAGGRVVVASRAVVRHVRAQALGRRRSAVDRGVPAVVRRRAGMQVVLCNTSPLLVPLLVLRYVIGGIGRAFGFLAVARQPARALAEIRAVTGLLLRPRVVTTGRRDRSGLREVPHRELRHLFPPASRRWHFSPYRIGRLGASTATTPTRPTGAVETGPVSEEAESLDLGDSAIARFFRKPASVLFLAMSVVAMVAERHVLSAAIHGGRLLPAPSGARDLWAAYLASFHPSSVGSFTPAPPSLAILAAGSTILFGKAWLLVDLVVLGAVPLSALSAFAAARALTPAVRVRVWAGVVYSLLPAVTGVVAGGRIDVAAVAILLPQVLRAVIAALRRGLAAGAWRYSLGAGLVLAVAVAFAPVLWLVAVPSAVLGIGYLERESDVSATLGRLLAAVVVLAVPIVVLVPWSGHLISHPRLLVTGSGLPEFYAAHHAPSALSLALLHAGGPAQPPIWIGFAVLAAGLLGLNRQSRMAVARTGVSLLVIGVAVAIAITRNADVTKGVPDSRHWPGLALLVAGAGALMSALVAVVGARPALRQQDFGWRQPAAVVLVGLALISSVWLAVGWVIRGAGRPLTAGSSEVLPPYAQALLAKPTAPRAVVIDRTGSQVRYAVVRDAAGPRLGDADTAPTTTQNPVQLRLASAVRDLVAGRAGAGAELGPLDIGYVVAPTTTARQIAPALGKSTTLSANPAVGATVWVSSLPTGELTILAPADAARAVDGGAARATRALVARPGAADVTVPAGPPDRLLVLAEPASGGWHASLAGTSLQPRTAFGWAQAFSLPAGGGRLHLGYDDSSRNAWLVVELIALVLIVGASLPGRREDEL